VAGDVKQVQLVALKAWKFTYRKIYSTKSIERYVSSYYSDQRFKERLPRVRKGFDWFFVALDGKRVIGYSHIGRGRIGWELLRIYLLPQYIGKGIGKKLLQLGEAFLKRKKARTYFVTSHKRNRLGIEFYLRNGFKITSKMVEGRSSLCFEKRLQT
jgi:ribosomal protein S18 acetylase RimI-like enzyme